jgi:hypothetical protein
MQVLDRGGQAVACGSCLSQVLDHSAQAAARKAVLCASQVLDCGAEAVARGAARCASHVLDRVRPLPEKPFLLRRRYLIVVPRPLPRRRSLCVART